MDSTTLSFLVSIMMLLRKRNACFCWGVQRPLLDLALQLSKVRSVQPGQGHANHLNSLCLYEPAPTFLLHLDCQFLSDVKLCCCCIQLTWQFVGAKRGRWQCLPHFVLSSHSVCECDEEGFGVCGSYVERRTVSQLGCLALPFLVHRPTNVRVRQFSVGRNSCSLCYSDCPAKRRGPSVAVARP
jgi:hypothetical protein